MKTKVFFMLCFLLGIGLTKLSAQPAIGKSGSATSFETFIDFAEKVPLNCDPNNIGFLVGTVRCHFVLHYSNYDGIDLDYDWIKQQFIGELVLEATNEVFKVNDILKAEGPNFTQPCTGQFNVIGNQGSHYIVNYLWSDWADPNNITIVSVKCPGDK
jgi:hypothetical protein